MSNQSSWMGFVLALAAVGTVPESAQAIAPETSSALETRLNNLNTALQQRTQQLPQNGKNFPSHTPDIICGFANGGGGRGFGNARRGGWADGANGGGFGNARRGGWADGNAGGGFVNVNPWRNGWSDGGGFYNRRWPDGGGFVNRW